MLAPLRAAQTEADAQAAGGDAATKVDFFTMVRGEDDDRPARRCEGGFADPVFDSQTVFRTLMQAMACPGTCQPLQTSVAAPAPLGATAAAAALTLCDHDTPLWLDANLSAARGVVVWLAFHTGAPVTPRPADAHFALVSSPSELIALEDFAQGSQEYPDRSTTLILQVGPAGAFRAAGARRPRHPS